MDIREISSQVESLLKHSTSLGKVWYFTCFALRMVVTVVVGSTVYADKSLICVTNLPGCSDMCYNAYAPISPWTFWMVQLCAVSIPMLFFKVVADWREVRHYKEQRKQLTVKAELLRIIQPTTRLTLNNTLSSLEASNEVSLLAESSFIKDDGAGYEQQPDPISERSLSITGSDINEWMDELQNANRSQLTSAAMLRPELLVRPEPNLEDSEASTIRPETGKPTLTRAVKLAQSITDVTDQTSVVFKRTPVKPTPFKQVVQCGKGTPPVEIFQDNVVKLTYLMCASVRTAIEIAFCLSIHLLFTYEDAQCNYDDDSNKYCQMSALTIKVPQQFRCRGPIVEAACKQQLINEHSAVPCFVPRFFEQTIFHCYMQAVTYLCIAVSFADAIYYLYKICLEYLKSRSSTTNQQVEKPSQPQMEEAQ